MQLYNLSDSLNHLRLGVLRHNRFLSFLPASTASSMTVMSATMPMSKLSSMSMPMRSVTVVVTSLPMSSTFLAALALLVGLLLILLVTARLRG